MSTNYFKESFNHMRHNTLWLLLIISGSCNIQNKPIIESNVKVDKTAISATQDKTSPDRGIVYFSTDDGNTWEDKSNGLPENITFTDIAVSNELIGATTKQHGVFLYNLRENKWVNTADRPQTTANLDALIFHDDKLFVGTEKAGAFISTDNGHSWRTLNDGLGNLTIRKFAVFDHRLYAGTNGGLYSLSENEHNWSLEYGSSLQVNGITAFEDEIYIGTQQGVFKSKKEKKEWKQILANHSLHNISSDDRMVYAMTYNQLLASGDKGNSWQSLQKGLPAQLYSFQLLKKDNSIFVGQWDGVYKKQDSTNWTFSSTGLPGEFAVTEMKIYRNMLVIGCSERKLNKGVTIDK